MPSSESRERPPTRQHTQAYTAHWVVELEENRVNVKLNPKYTLLYICVESQKMQKKKNGKKSLKSLINFKDCFICYMGGD